MINTRLKFGSVVIAQNEFDTKGSKFLIQLRNSGVKDYSVSWASDKDWGDTVVLTSQRSCSAKKREFDENSYAIAKEMEIEKVKIEPNNDKFSCCI